MFVSVGAAFKKKFMKRGTNTSNNLVLRLLQRQVLPHPRNPEHHHHHGHTLLSLDASRNDVFSDSVPPQCKIPLSLIEDEKLWIRKTVILGFSHCCCFLLSYAILSTEEYGQMIKALYSENPATQQQQQQDVLAAMQQEVLTYQHLSDQVYIAGEDEELELYMASLHSEEPDEAAAMLRQRPSQLNHFVFVYWKFDLDRRLKLSHIVPMIGQPVRQVEGIPRELSLCREESNDEEMTRTRLNELSHNMFSHISRSALFKSVANGAMNCSLHIQTTESVDSPLFYNYLFCDIDEQERRHILSIMPSPIGSHSRGVDSLWGIIIEFNTNFPHPTPFDPTKCVVTADTTSDRNSSVLAREIICIPNANCIDVICYDVIRNDDGSTDKQRQNTTFKDFNVGPNEIIFQEGPSGFTYKFEALFQKYREATENGPYICLRIESNNHLNIEVFLNNLLADNERLVDYDYRITKKLEYNEIFVIIVADYITKQAARTHNRLILYTIMDLQRNCIKVVLKQRITLPKQKVDLVAFTRQIQFKLNRADFRLMSRTRTPKTYTNENIFQKSESMPYFVHPFTPVAILSPNT